ncbi:MAG: radical SAM protein [Acidobacteria bacterium]|nr:MAG: radical SAM protein [Acidobacteriota bacterium]
MGSGVSELRSPEREQALEAAWERLDPRFRLPNQVLGRRSTVGCVALEITQRCNLDCTLCYLSENAEATPDPPLAVLFERIERIRDLYGPGVGVQVTGGDPTLRERSELVAVVKRLSERGLRPSLFTNGLLATTDLIEELVDNGLFDVAFHVDTTQRRKRWPTEAALNEVREEYIRRVRGLPVAVIFNTSVHAGNLDEVPMLARFFLERSDVVGMASFQLQADTGRGEWRTRDAAVSLASVRERIARGTGADSLSWDTALLGHPDCHQATMLATVGGRAVDLLDDPPLYERFLEEFKHLSFDRRNVRATAREVLKIAFRKPYFVFRGGAYLLRKLWGVRRELLAGGRTGKITFFIQNFQDAGALDPERIANCSFMVMTDQGPVSMCEHNARRDEYLGAAPLLPTLGLAGAAVPLVASQVGPAGLPLPTRAAAGTPHAGACCGGK